MHLYPLRPMEFTAARKGHYTPESHVQPFDGLGGSKRQSGHCAREKLPALAANATTISRSSSL
jgi:hypothetical protein